MMPPSAALPIEGTPVLANNSWSVRLPVRVEEVTISKQVVVRERVLIKRRQIQDIAHIDARLRHEELRATRSGTLKIAEQATEKIPNPDSTRK